MLHMEHSQERYFRDKGENKDMRKREDQAEQERNNVQKLLKTASMCAQMFNGTIN